MRQRTILPLLPAVAGRAGQGGVKPVKLERRMAIVREKKILARPPRLPMTGVAGMTHLALMRVRMARPAVAAQTCEHCLRQFPRLRGDAMTLLARESCVLTPERE